MKVLALRLCKLLIVWIVVAIVMGATIATICQPENAALGRNWLPLSIANFTRFRFGIGIIWRWAGDNIGVGIGLEWWNLPGTLLGFVAGLFISRMRWTNL